MTKDKRQLKLFLATQVCGSGTLPLSLTDLVGTIASRLVMFKYGLTFPIVLHLFCIHFAFILLSFGIYLVFVLYLFSDFAIEARQGVPSLAVSSN